MRRHLLTALRVLNSKLKASFVRYTVSLIFSVSDTNTKTIDGSGNAIEGGKKKLLLLKFLVLSQVSNCVRILSLVLRECTTTTGSRGSRQKQKFIPWISLKNHFLRLCFKNPVGN